MNQQQLTNWQEAHSHLWRVVESRRKGRMEWQRKRVIHAKSENELRVNFECVEAYGLPTYEYRMREATEDEKQETLAQWKRNIAAGDRGYYGSDQ